jgi:short-subunit dehydrogenase
MEKNGTALITGASSGIGYELAKRFAKDRYDLVLVARDNKRLLEIKRELSASGITVTVISKDLAVRDAPKEIYDELEKKKIDIDVLVNNAGFGGLGFFSETDIGKETDMITVNITALTQMTKLFLKGMVKKKHGKILNVASVAAFLPGPLMAVYYATKSYVLSFSEALANEVKDKGITVTVLCPGPTRTKFFSRASFKNTTVLTSMMMDAEKVAGIGYDGLMKGKLVVIPGFLNNLQIFFIRFIPRGLLAKIARKMVESG